MNIIRSVRLILVLVLTLPLGAGAGLGGKPYRDGSYEYYVGVPQRTNDIKGYAPFLLAAIELERAAAAAGGQQQKENTRR
ncbi:MAG TPA: hypothetical protein VF514_13720 [Bacteroidota bacterium]